MEIIIILLLLFTLPVMSVVGWIFNLMKFIRAKKENSEVPDTHSKEEMKAIRSNLIIASVIAFILVAAVVGLIALFTMGIAYM